MELSVEISALKSEGKFIYSLHLICFNLSLSKVLNFSCLFVKEMFAMDPILSNLPKRRLLTGSPREFVLGRAVLMLGFMSKNERTCLLQKSQYS